MNIDQLINTIVGKAFEIECRRIRIHGMLDNHPPLCEGPGTIRAESEGRISFRMHNQIRLTPEALSSLQWYKKDDTGLEPSRQIRIFADDYDGLSWIGSWTIPETERVRRHESIGVGRFDQLST